MSFVCRCGESLFLRKIDRQEEHLYIIITEPYGNPRKSVIVNITEKRGTSDITTILKPSDHRFIIKDSVIRYSDAVLAPCDKLEQAVNDGFFESHDPFPENLLKRIQDGLIASILTPKDIKMYCKKLWKIP